MSTKVKKQLMLLTLMLLVFGLWAYNETKVFKSIDETAKMIAPEQHLIKTLNFKGEIINYAYAKDTGNLVVIEELNHQYRMVFYDKELKLLWEKKINHTNGSIIVYISDNCHTLVLHKLSENDQEVYVHISTWDNQGNLLAEIKDDPTYYGVSPSGNYLFKQYIDFEGDFYSGEYLLFKDFHNICIYDKHLKPINLTGFNKDDALVTCKVFSDSLVVCLKKYKSGEGDSYHVSKKFEFYNFKNNTLSLIKTTNLKNDRNYDINNFFFQENSLIQVNNYFIDRVSKTVYDLRGNEIMKYSAPYLAVLDNKFQEYSIESMKNYKTFAENQKKSKETVNLVGESLVYNKNNNLIINYSKYYPYRDHLNQLYDNSGKLFYTKFDCFVSDKFKNIIFIDKTMIKLFGEY